MNIQHKETDGQGKFFIEKEGDTVAEIVYTKQEPATIIIEHTEVDESLQGQNIGYQLVHKTVEYARSKQLKIVPICQFAKALFDKQPQWQDVIAANA